MRIIYAFRVILISIEALALAGTWLAFIYFESELELFAKSISLNAEILKYLVLMPFVLAAWIINESRTLLQEDKVTIRILTQWEDYWKLKTHTWVSLGYSVIFVFISLIPWLSKSGISTGAGLLLFIASIVGQLILAISVYAARIQVKELIAHINNP